MTNKDKNRDVYTLADIFRAMELELIENAQRNLSKHEDWENKLGFKWEQWQLAKLRNITTFRVENRKIIKSYQKEIEDTIEEVLTINYDDTYKKSMELTESIHKDFEFDIEMSSKSLIDTDIEIPEGNFFHVNDDKLKVMIEEMQSTFVNQEGVIMRKMDDTYRQTLDKIALKLGAGATTVQQATDEAIKNFLERGIDSVTYKNGRKVNIAAYAEMYLRTANQQAGFLASGKARDESGNYFVLMSRHANCSPMCLPFQGTVMIDDVYTQITKDKAEQLSKESGFKLLSYAMSKHAFHPNCRHNLVTWVGGSVPEPFDEEKNKEAVYKYKQEQKQRRLENELRKWKRIKVGSSDDDNRIIAHERVKELQKELREHIKENPGLRRNYWRERAEHILDKNIPELESRMIIPNEIYEDVTHDWISNIEGIKYSKVITNDYFEKEGTTYNSDNSKINLDFGQEEIEMANILSNKLNKNIELVPEVAPFGQPSISTPDYRFDGEYWDLKTINGSSKNTIRDRISKSSHQSKNFIINLGEKSSLTPNQFIEYSTKLYGHYNTSFIDKLILVNQNEIIMVLKKR